MSSDFVGKTDKNPVHFMYEPTVIPFFERNRLAI